MSQTQQKRWLLVSSFLLIALFVFHLFAWKIDETFLSDDVLLYQVRLPRTLTALFCGALLAVSGLLLQVLFDNPLAGPSILGISSGASLGVALAIIVGIGNLGITFSSLAGALAYSILLLVVARFVKSTLSLLLVGIMLSSFTGAFIDVIQVYAQELKLKYFTLWGMGSLQQVDSEGLMYLSITLVIVISLSIFIARDLTVFSQGEQFSNYLGVPIGRLKWLIIIITSLAVSMTTAFCGPISFIGIAVPNMVRIAFKTTNGFTLIIGSLIFGPMLLLLCDGLILLLDSYFILPINAVTAIFGGPFIIWIILKRLK